MARVVPSAVVRLIDSTIPQSKSEELRPLNQFSLDWTYRGHLKALLSFLDRLPDHLVTVVDEDYHVFLVAQEAIRGMVEEWQSGNHSKSLDRFPGSKKQNPVTVIRRTMRLCPDDVSSSGSGKFEFISDTHLRSVLEEDSASVERALTNSEWKAATVLAGSVIEALLLWVLTEHETEASGTTRKSAEKLGLRCASDPLDRWGLDAFARVAHDLCMLSLTTLTEVHLAKDFRNLIHPGRTRRTGQQCDRSTAFQAIAALDHVGAEMSDWSKRDKP